MNPLWLAQVLVLTLLLVMILLFMASERKEYAIFFLFIGIFYAQTFHVQHLKQIIYIIVLFYLFIQIEKINPNKVNRNSLFYLVVRQISIFAALFYIIQSITLRIRASIIMALILLASESKISKIINSHFFHDVKEKETHDMLTYENALSIVWVIIVSLLTIQFSENSTLSVSWLKSITSTTISSISIGLIIGYIFDKTVFYFEKHHKKNANQYSILSLLGSFILLLLFIFLTDGSYVLGVAFFAIICWQIKSQKKVVKYMTSKLDLFFEAFVLFLFGTTISILEKNAVIAGLISYIVIILIDFSINYITLGKRDIIHISFSEVYGPVFLALVILFYALGVFNTVIISYALTLSILSYLFDIIINSKFYFPKKKKQNEYSDKN